MIMRQFGVAEKKVVKSNNFSNAALAVKEIKQKPNAPLINKSAKFEPVSNNRFNSNEVEIISTFEDEIKTEGIDDSLKPLILNGKIVNSTRPRIVPNAAVNEVSTVSFKTEMPTYDSSVSVKFQMPASGRISSEFGSRFHPIDKKMKFHGGIDIAIPTGTTVKAAAEGIVTFAGWRGGYGNTVIIQHADGSETLYAHNSKLLVAEGQKITAGSPISLSGSTGKSTGPHLHFELRRNGELVNPSKFLSNVLSGNAER
jgi:murein DD-endopeptidase MepM/ murein hydrolase activator NlpD